MLPSERAITAGNVAVLKNSRDEHFAQLVAAGKTPTQAYGLAGYSEAGAHASAARLLRNATIRARVAELQKAVSERAVEKATVDRAWVLAQLRENVDRAMQAVEMTDSKGKPTGEFRYEGGVANRALELIGKELGMFRERLEINFLDKLFERMTAPELDLYARTGALPAWFKLATSGKGADDAAA
jgi:phage terminase small subunit